MGVMEPQMNTDEYGRFFYLCVSVFIRGSISEEGICDEAL
jgi:hypothetical protein